MAGMTDWIVSLRRCDTLMAMRTAKTVFSVSFWVDIGPVTSFCVGIGSAGLVKLVD